MARPLEFKRRVQLSELDIAVKPPRARPRTTPLVVGTLAYASAFALAWGVSTKRVPIAEALAQVLDPPAVALARAPVSRVESASAPAMIAKESMPTFGGEAPTSEPIASPEPSPGAGDVAPVPAPSPSTAPLGAAPLPAFAPSSPVPALQALPSPRPFEPPANVPSVAPPPPPSPPLTAQGAIGPGASCEAALAAYVEDASKKAPPDLSATDYGRVLNRGEYLSRCGVPTTTAVDLCVAVQNGRAVGVTVHTSPQSSKLDRCLAHVLRGQSFPSHPRLDVVRTRFAP